MARKFVDGLEGVGHVEGLSDELSAAFLRLDDRGAIVSLPSVGSVFELFSGLSEQDADGVPPTLHFRDTKGAYFLGECRDMGGTVSTLGASLTRIRAGRAIEAGGSEADYSQVDGMSSEIDGLSSWSGMSTVTQTTDTKTWVNLRAEHQESIQIGGKADVAIESSFMWNPSPKGNVFGIRARE